MPADKLPPKATASTTERVKAKMGPSALLQRISRAKPQHFERTMKATHPDGSPIEGHTGETYNFTAQSLGANLAFGEAWTAAKGDPQTQLLLGLIMACDEFREEPDKESLLEILAEMPDPAIDELLKISNAVNGITSTREAKKEDVAAAEAAAEFQAKPARD